MKAKPTNAEFINQVPIEYRAAWIHYHSVAMHYFMEQLEATGTPPTFSEFLKYMEAKE